MDDMLDLLIRIFIPALIIVGGLLAKRNEKGRNDRRTTQNRPMNRKPITTSVPKHEPSYNSKSHEPIYMEKNKTVEPEKNMIDYDDFSMGNKKRKEKIKVKTYIEKQEIGSQDINLDLSFKKENLIKGVIMAEILSKPKSLRKH